MEEKVMEPTERPSGIRLVAFLFLHFIKIGAFAFGSGWSILAQMEQDFVDKRQWMSKNDLVELIAVGKSLPGIMVVNITMLFGYQLAGPLGGIACAIGLCLPAVIVLTLVTAIYDLIKSNYWVFAALRGVQCAVVPIIGCAAISLGKETLKTKLAVILCVGGFCVCAFTNVSNLTLVIGGAIASLVWMGVKEHGNA